MAGPDVKYHASRDGSNSNLLFSSDQALANVLREILAVIVHHLLTMVDQPLRMKDHTPRAPVVDNHRTDVALAPIVRMVHEATRVPDAARINCQP
jgi:hypothetical protein